MNVTNEGWRDGPDPRDRLHRVADRMLERFAQDPENGGLRAIVFLTLDLGDGTQYATTALSGYGPPTPDIDAMSDLMAHLGAMFKANGMEMQFVPLDKPIGQG